MGINEKTAENKANDFATSPVPAAERKGFWSTAAVWMGWCISLSAFLTGGTIAAGCTLGTALLAVLLGNLILVGIGSLCGIIGYRTGLTTYTIYRLIFGEKGNVIVSVVMAISLMAFIGVLMDSFSSTLNGLLPWFPIPLATCIFAVCILLSSINGFKGLSFVSAIAAPALIILCYCRRCSHLHMDRRCHQNRRSDALLQKGIPCDRRRRHGIFVRLCIV